jgi:muramoyltetrapeptide carboxypeptidase
MKHIILPATALLLGFSACHKDEPEEIINEIHMDTTVVYNPSFIIQGQKDVTEDLTPAFLKEGDCVAVCALSNFVSQDDLSEGIETLKSWGLNVIEAPNLYLRDNRYAGSLKERLEGFQQMLDNPQVKAIFFARGGYGAAQVLPYTDWTEMLKNPKWVIGYSDITALHIALNNMGVETVSGAMMRGFNKDKESIDMLKDALFGSKPEISIATNENCVKGTATGRLVGGNLSIIYSLSGTAFDLNTRDAILFIEDTGEANYSVDRMLLNLQQSGKLQQIKGLIVGEFSGGNQGNDLPLNEIIAKYAAPLNIPVVYGISSGHDNKNLPLIMGARATISVDGQKASVSYSALAK